MRLKNSLKLFLVFFRIGAFTFGGGYAMLPLIARELSEKNDWIKQDEIVDIVAVSQSMPGVLAINMATFTGYKIAGIAGAIASTLGVVLPSFIIISALSFFYVQFKDNRYVSYAFDGINAVVVFLILSSFYGLSKKAVKKAFGAVILIISCALVLFRLVDAVIVIIAAGVIGVIWQAATGKASRAKQ